MTWRHVNDVSTELPCDNLLHLNDPEAAKENCNAALPCLARLRGAHMRRQQGQCYGWWSNYFNIVRKRALIGKCACKTATQAVRKNVRGAS